MNRAERRKRGIAQPPPKMKHLPESQYRQDIDDAYRRGFDESFLKACDLAVMYMLAIPLIVLNDHFNEIRLKECDGVPRIEHFFDLCVDTFEEYNRSENILTRLLSDVEDKTGFDISKRVFIKKEGKT